MTACEKLANAMFPDVTLTPEDLENTYPPRQLKEGARVTRIPPSPTGYLHLGVLYSAMVNKLTADASGGLFYFRLEDTDSKREVQGGAEDILRGLNAYGITPQEGFVAPGVVQGDYGPYRQSERAGIYHVYAKSLVAQGLAYPCFCSEEERQAARQRQEAAKVRTGYYGEYALCRRLTTEEALSRVQAGESYVVRLRSPGSEERRIQFDDLIKGKIEMPENDEDIVLLKSDGIPTYHFAHAVDDHLMRTTHVLRGDEWISSVPKHLQLFRVLGFKPPKYGHISPIMKLENGGKRKLSKRKDPEAAVHYFVQQGYPAGSVIEYLMTIAASDFEDWRRRNPDASRAAFPFTLKKMSPSGALFDPDKLNDVSKAVISRMDADEVAQAVTAWAAEYAPDFHALLARDPAFTRGIFAIDRGGSKPRKDLAKWADAPDFAAYFFDETFDGAFALPEHIAPADATAVLAAYKGVYDPAQDKQAWFQAIKDLAPSLGFCPEVKEYKKNPDGYKGHAGDMSTILRLAVTGRANTPDLCSIMQLLGRERVLSRIDRAIQRIDRAGCAE
ncbi:MAG TPA: glutamate--tRNA ligase [Firmicutes bacterium]|nr:glutamate--tRNA ligase [Bacillota bacterium]